jgi:hypothetical protein
MIAFFVIMTMANVNMFSEFGYTPGRLFCTHYVFTIHPTPRICRFSPSRSQRKTRLLIVATVIVKSD